MKTTLKHILLSLIPSLILGLGFFFLICFLNGMDEAKNTSPMWIVISVVGFIFLFVSSNKGQNIFGQFLRYSAYECWISPLCALIYIIKSILQTKNSLSNIGVLATGFEGIFLILIFGVVGGLCGLVLYLISNSILKKANQQVQIPNQEMIATPQMFYKKAREEKILNILQWFCPTFVILILIFMIANKLTVQKEVITNDPNVSLQRGYVLNSKELKILDILFKDDMTGFVKGSPSLLEKNKKLLTVSVGQIAKDYDENQVAADQKYFKKLLRLSGQIESINSGLGNEPYITLNGINSFLLPQAHFKESNTAKIAKLRKKQQVYLVCTGNGAIMGIPTFKDCQFARDYAEKEITEIKSELEDFLDGKKDTSEIIAHIAILPIAITRALPQTSVCFSDGRQQCLKEIRDVTHKKNFIKITKKVVNELKRSGVQASDMRFRSNS
ncbi:hypothetical protein [Legionella sp. 227]|uniref:OB-fold protein n=1 Tax=Legionella sp. 227 TaxID=3367288 RepID=UPI00370D306C